MQSFSVSAINDAGQVLGTAFSPNYSTYYSVVWTNGVPAVLPTLGGQQGTWAYAINKDGVVVGYSFLPASYNGSYETYHGFVWYPKSGIVDLGIKQSKYDYNEADWINDSGLVVGDDGATFRWFGAGSYSYVNTSPIGSGGGNVYPLSVNNAGDILVQTYGAAGVVKANETILLSGMGPRVAAMNDGSEVVGYDYNSGTTTGIYYLPTYWDQSGQPTRLQLPSNPGQGGFANSINDGAEIVGYVETPTYDQVATYWTKKGDRTDLNSRLPVTTDKWQLSSAGSINNLGRIAGNGYLNGNEAVFVMTPPLLIRGDVDRDGAIDFTSPTDETTAANPFRFWVNSDHDAVVDSSNLLYKEVEQDDVDNWTKSGPRDCDSNVISCERDLEDYARLAIYLPGLSAKLRSGAVCLALQWRNTSNGTPSIKLFHAVGKDSIGYLTSIPAAKAQVTEPAIKDTILGGTLVGPGTFVLPSSLFAKITEDDPTAYFIFEGCSAGAGELKILVLDPANAYSTLAEGGSIWLDLKDPRDLVERWSCENSTLTPVAPITPLHYYPGSPTFPPPATEPERDYVLYVHGWNMQEFEKQRWIETTYKRLWQLGYKGRVGGFSWPCGTSNFSYDPSEERAWQAGAELEKLMASLTNAGYRVRVLAHSMGNVVTGEALREAGSAQVAATYIASQAAIPLHVYDPAAPSIPGLKPVTPNVYATYWYNGQSTFAPETWPSTNDSYLGKTYMTGAAKSYFNFYNPQDYALIGNSLFQLHPGWLLDQRLKPDTFLRGYDYDSTNHFTYNGTTIGFPDWTFQIFSYAAQARSRALGAGSSGGVFSGQINLNAAFGYKTQHLYHSAQFRSFEANRVGYWRAILQYCGLPTL